MCIASIFPYIYDIINEHSQIWNHYFSLMFPIQFDTWKEVIEKVLLLHHLLYLFECITHSSLLSLEDIELIVILSYWFIIIFFFMLKKVPNISNYFAFDCFIFFFQFSVFYFLIFFKSWTFYHICCEKIYLIFFKK